MIDKIINTINVVLNSDVTFAKRSSRFAKTKNNGPQHAITGLHLFFNEKHISLQSHAYSFGSGLIFQRHQSTFLYIY